MLSPLFKAFMLFAIPIAALARLPAEGHWTGGAVNDWVSSGNYLIYSCGSQAATVKNLLDLSYLYLQTAILSTNTPIYKAWFKSADPAFVKTVLTSMALGTNLTNSAQVSSRMTLICVNGRDPSLEAMWNVCSDPRVLTASQIDPPVTFVCPRFFEMPTAPVNDDCLSVDTSPRSDGLNNNQYKVLVGNLAELYVHEALGLSTSQKLRHMVGEWPCLRLSPFNALRNPGSYAYFAASVRAGCTYFPTKLPTQHYRILSELNVTSATPEGVGEGNQTSAVTLDCISNVIDSASCPS